MEAFWCDFSGRIAMVKVHSNVLLWSLAEYVIPSTQSIV